VAKAETPKKNVIAEYLQLVVSVVVIVFVVRSFIFEPFRIPSPSMDPTLKTGDYVIVTKFSYGFGRQSIFDIPLIQDRLFWREPKRGNVVVFADPIFPRQKKLIKRVVRNAIILVPGRRMPTLKPAATSSPKRSRARTASPTSTSSGINIPTPCSITLAPTLCPKTMFSSWGTTEIIRLTAGHPHWVLCIESTSWDGLSLCCSRSTSNRPAVAPTSGNGATHSVGAVSSRAFAKRHG